MLPTKSKENNQKKSPDKKRTSSSNNTSIGKINTHGLLLNKIVFSPPKDEDHYREMDIDEQVINVRSNHNVITNQPIANTKSYNTSGNDNDEYAILDDLENASVVKDDEFTSDQKFAPILKMNNTGKLKFFTKLQQVQPSLVPAASITGKVQFKELNHDGNEDLSMMQEEDEEEQDLDILSSPKHQLHGNDANKMALNNNHLKRKVNIMEVDDEVDVLDKNDDSNHSIQLGGGVNKLNLNFDMSDSEGDNSNNSNIGIANILQEKFKLQANDSDKRDVANKDDFGQSRNVINEGDVSIDAVVRGEENINIWTSPDKRTSGDSNKGKVESPLKNISINLNDNSDISSSSAHKKLLTNKLNQQNLNSSLLDRNSSKFLRLSPSGNRNNYADKENQIHQQVIPSSPSILSSRKKLKSLPKLPPNHMNSPMLNVKMMSPLSKPPASLDLDMSSSIKSSRNNSPLRNFNIETDSQLKQSNRVNKLKSPMEINKNINISQYMNNQKNDLNTLMKVINNMQNNVSKLANIPSEINSEEFINLKQKYDLEVEAKMRLDTQNEQLLLRVSRLEKELAESHKKINKLESQILNKNQREFEMENKYNQLEMELNNGTKKLKEELECIKKENSENVEKLKILESSNTEKLNALTKERDDLLKDINSKKELITNLNKSVSEFEKTHEEGLSKLSTELYEQYSKKHEDKLNHLKQSYTQALNSLKKLVHSLRDEVTKKNEEINKLKQQVLNNNQINTRRSGYHR